MRFKAIILLPALLATLCSCSAPQHAPQPTQPNRPPAPPKTPEQIYAEEKNRCKQKISFSSDEYTKEKVWVMENIQKIDNIPDLGMLPSDRRSRIQTIEIMNQEVLRGVELVHKTPSDNFDLQVASWAPKWRHFSSAYDINGNKLQFSVLRKEVRPMPDLVTTLEICNIRFSREYMISHRRSGIKLKIKSAADQDILLEIPAAYVDAFLEKISESNK
jgi:hypothetical protein